MTKLSILIIAALAAGSFVQAPARAQLEDKTAATHCLKEKDAVEIGVYRGRTVCYSKKQFPAPVSDTVCADGGAYGAYFRHYMIAGGELYCVISQVFWEARGHLAAKIGPRADWLTNQNHCANQEGFWKILGAHQGAVVCMMRSTGQSDIAERTCGKGGYEGGVVMQFGSEKYCLLQAGANASRFGWAASLMIPECDIRHRGRHAKSLGLDSMTEDNCLAKLATVP